MTSLRGNLTAPAYATQPNLPADYHTLHCNKALGHSIISSIHRMMKPDLRPIGCCTPSDDGQTPVVLLLAGGDRLDTLVGVAVLMKVIKLILCLIFT
jgi:hypothetical protein